VTDKLKISEAGVPVSVRIPSEILAELRKLADEDGITFSEVVRRGLLMLLGYCPTCGHKTVPGLPEALHVRYTGIRLPR
jgi:Ribbon-helix-helix protein, copG family